MSPTVAFRSEHPDAVEAWDLGQLALAAFDAAKNALMDDYPGDDRGVLVQSGWGRLTAVGLSGAQPEGPWRENQRHGGWTPNTRLKAGRELAKRLSGIVYAWPGMPGMSDRVMGAGRMYWPGCMKALDGAVWVTWGLPGGVAPEVDLEVWEPMKLSAFHLAHEAWLAEHPKVVKV